MTALLSAVGCPTLGACYDPASLLIDGFDPIDGVEPLADSILIARVRDAVAGTSDHPGRESDIGRGQVDFAAYFAALDRVGYRNTTFIRRTDPQRTPQGVADAKAHIESLIR
jgi:sugar phosphate isomerase/epimerase